MKKWRFVLILVSVAIAGFVLTGCRGKKSVGKKLVIFHAGSLSVPFRDVSEAFMAENPDVEVLAEAAGSRDCARKLTELGRSCDVFGSADYKVVENLMMLEYADFNIRFARNEMVIGYTDKSRSGEKINADNWHEILMKKEVAFGRADPNRDPCGYRTLMTLKLAQRHYGIASLADKLQNKHGRKYIRPKETDLLALLEGDEIDYIFIYRSVALQHGLRILVLPDEINLKLKKFRELYNTATVKITGKKPGEYIQRKGEEMVYSVTIPKTVMNRESAEKWVEFLLSEKGKAIMEASGQPALRPAKADMLDNVPERLKKYCEPTDWRL